MEMVTNQIRKHSLPCDQVAGETEVKAQIKLRFITGAGQPVVVIRSFQLTQRKSSMAFKALDNVLQTVNRATGAREALSYRCADIDRILPSLMGVSAAVLESVVFVHQEDSNWPLADAATVKRRFDDIFAATKYTKALEALRKLRTDKAAEVREMRLRLETLRALRQSATRLRDAAEAGETARAAHETRIAELEARSDAIQRELEEVERQIAAVEELEMKRKQLEAQHSVLAEQNAATHARLVVGVVVIGLPYAFFRIRVAAVNSSMLEHYGLLADLTVGSLGAWSMLPRLFPLPFKSECVWGGRCGHLPRRT